MPTFTYDYSGEQRKWNTHAKDANTHNLAFPPQKYTRVHLLMAAGCNEMEAGLCQSGDGVTHWLGPGWLFLRHGLQQLQPAHPASAITRPREEGSIWAGGWSWKPVRSGLHPLRQALSHAQPHHLNMTKYWHRGELNSVCECVYLNL